MTATSPVVHLFPPVAGESKQEEEHSPKSWAVLEIDSIVLLYSIAFKYIVILYCGVLSSTIMCEQYKKDSHIVVFGCITVLYFSVLFCTIL